MIACRRSDVAAQNELARSRMRAARRLGETELATVNGAIAVGDRVILLGKEWAYVAESRARHRAEVYLASDLGASIDRAAGLERVSTTAQRSARDRLPH